VATRRQKIEVGAFLTVAAVLLAAVLGALIGVRRTDLVSYRIEFQENVAGLTEGSKVTYQGVPVGKVTDVVISKENIVCVKIGIEPRRIQLRKDVQAKLTMESVFGPIAIDLTYPGDRHQGLLPPGSLIPTTGSLREHIENQIPKTLDNLANVMARLDRTLAAIEPKRVAETVENLSSAIQQFEKTLAQVKPEEAGQLVRNLGKLIENTDATLAELRKQTDQLTTTLQDAVKQGSADVAGASRKLGDSLDSLQKAAERTQTLVEGLDKVVQENRKPLTEALERARTVLDKADRQLDGFDATEKSFTDAAAKVGGAADTVAQSRNDLRRTLDNVEISFTRTLDELERTLAATRRLIDYLERDPSSIIRGKAEPRGK